MFSDDPDRIRALCRDCAGLRGSQTHDEFIETLAHLGFLTCGE
jgi:hypothetical protein